ncbi:MAG: peptidogalycan biosysnthesis protein [Clostridia bacterium]|nr:peptidogalycan biosysnthesis protein [Clostridia bacterium]
MTEIKVFESSEFESLKDVWTSLQQGSEMTVFQQYIWYYGLNEQYAKKCFKGSEKAEYYVVYKDGEPKLIAPIHVKKHGFEYKGIGIEKGIYMVGQWSFTDYLNFIYKDFDSECAEAVIDELKKKYKGLPIHFNFVKEENLFNKFLAENYGDKKISETICVQTLPHDSFEEFHKTMTKYSRQNIRKAFNRENKTGMEIHIEELNTVSQQDADEFFSIYLGRSQKKNTINLKKDGLKDTVYKVYNKKYNDNLKEGLHKFNYITYNMVNNKDSYMIGIFHGTQKIGFIYGIMENENMWRNIIVCFDEEFSYYTPGRTAYFRYFRDILYADGKGTTVVTDMSRGTERHKYELGGTEHYLHNYKI